MNRRNRLNFILNSFLIPCLIILGSGHASSSETDAQSLRVEDDIIEEPPIDFMCIIAPDKCKESE